MVVVVEVEPAAAGIAGVAGVSAAAGEASAGGVSDGGTGGGGVCSGGPAESGGGGVPSFCGGVFSSLMSGSLPIGPGSAGH